MAFAALVLGAWIVVRQRRAGSCARHSVLAGWLAWPLALLAFALGLLLLFLR